MYFLSLFGRQSAILLTTVYFLLREDRLSGIARRQSRGERPKRRRAWKSLPTGADSAIVQISACRRHPIGEQGSARHFVRRFRVLVPWRPTGSSARSSAPAKHKDYGGRGRSRGSDDDGLGAGLTRTQCVKLQLYPSGAEGRLGASMGTIRAHRAIRPIRGWEESRPRPIIHWMNENCMHSCVTIYDPKSVTSRKQADDLAA